MYCEECGNPQTECHHVVYRSQSIVMIEMDLNKKRLCNICHRGKEGPHLNKNKDLQYKTEVQEKLYKLICKEYYTPEGLEKTLKINANRVQKIVKTLKIHNEGYNRDDIVRQLMGGRKYECEVLV